MSDLISRHAAIDAMTNTLWHYPNECYRNLKEYEFAKGLSELGLKSVPSVQPEIVRCGECKYAPKCYGDVLMRSRGGGYIYCPVEYCSAAERRTDERQT